MQASQTHGREKYEPLLPTRYFSDENKKLKQDVDDLTAQLREKDQGIQHLTATMERMRIEVMEAHDSKQRK